MRRIVRISTTFAIVLAAYWAYALAVVPRIEPAARPRPAGPSSAAPLRPIDRLVGLRELFQPGRWELEPETKVLESDQVKLLVQDYTSAPGSPRLELHPCTIIFTPNGASANETERTRQAIVLQTEKGAVLEFDQPFDLRRGSIGRLVSGRLNGQVVIRSEGKSPGPEDDLHAVTSDVQLTEQRVWIPNRIEFSLGRSTGRGSEMQIKLVPGDEAGKRHGLNVGGIESVEVRRLERLHLEPAATQASRGKPPAGSAQHASDLPIEVACRGPFRFDLGQQLATFEEQVDLLRIHPNGPSDQITCEVLAIQFARRRESARPPGAHPAAAPKAAGGLPDLEVRFVEARGNPVVVRAPSQQLEARGEDLKYDLQVQSIVLKGSHEVSMKQAANEIHARRIEYKMAAAGRLGEASAEGPGWLRGEMGSKLGQPLQAQWKGQLHVRPDEHNQHVISLIGDAEMNYGALGKLEAAEIHFWLNEAQSEAAPAAQPAQRFSVQPDRMLARNQVRLRAAQITGAVSQLEVWFDSPPTAMPSRPAPPRQSTSPHAEAGKGDRHLLCEAGHRPEVGRGPFRQKVPVTFSGRPQPNPAMQLARQFPRLARTAWRLATDDSQLTGLLVAQAGAGVYAGPQGAAGPASSGGPTPGVAIGRQFQVEGSLLRARVAGLGERAEISELIVEGNVRFVETQTAQAGEKPLAVAGDRIHVVDAGKPHAAVGVTGNPARFEGRGLVLVGSNINLNAGTNRLWIDGPGRVEILMDRDLQGRPITAVGSETQPTGPLVIQWQDRMTLDGRTVRFDESVVATAHQQQLRTETLEVGFREPIRFSDSKQASRPEIETMVCRGRVILEGREADGSAKTSAERVDVMDLTINRTTGAIRASGPGRVVSVRLQSAQTPPVIPDGLARPGAGGDGAAKPLVYLDVRFQRELTGNLLQRQMVFHEQVRCIYVPVASWDARFDDDSPEAIGPQGVTLRSDRLAATQWTVPGRAGRAWGLEATGTTLAEGQTFTAQGTRMTYDQAKGLLVLEGDGRTDATLYLQQHPGQRRTAQQSRRILFWPAAKRFTLEGFRALEIPNLPGGQKGGDGPVPGAR